VSAPCVVGKCGPGYLSLVNELFVSMCAGTMLLFQVGDGVGQGGWVRAGKNDLFFRLKFF